MDHGDDGQRHGMGKKIARFFNRQKMTMKKGSSSRDTGRAVEEEEAAVDPWDFPEAVDVEEHPSLCTDSDTHVTSHVDAEQVNADASSSSSSSSPNLFVANCGPAVGLSHDIIASVFSSFGELKGVYAADESGARVIVSYSDDRSARAAIEAFHARPCLELGGRTLHIRYSLLQLPTTKVKDCVSVSLTAAEINIPGLFMLHDFVNVKEEQELLAAVDSRPWNGLAKRRVQHYGYEFCYDTRNVDTKRHLGELPSFVSHIIKRISSSFPNLDNSGNLLLDQLTVNEYPSGVGLSPHIDTHSAFEGLIFSLSLAGPCIMEFRKYTGGAWLTKAASGTEMKAEDSENSSNFLRRAIYLPPRSMLLLSEEARYAWHHYIPHHKMDMVQDSVIRRGLRRVSFTIRKVRSGPCNCEFPEYCDSQR